MAPSKSITNDVYFTPIGRNQFSIKLVRAHFHLYIILYKTRNEVEYDVNRYHL